MRMLARKEHGALQGRTAPAVDLVAGMRGNRTLACGSELVSVLLSENTEDLLPFYYDAQANARLGCLVFQLDTSQILAKLLCFCLDFKTRIGFCKK